MAYGGQVYNEMIANRTPKANGSDVVFTPEPLARAICSMFKISGKVLEPCKGNGAILKFLPANAEWCEASEGRNFYDYTDRVDWIVTNPPYSDFNRFLDHCFNIAKNIVVLVPLSKMFKSLGTIRAVARFGGFVSITSLPARDAGFPFGYPLGIFHIQKNYRGTTDFNIHRYSPELPLLVSQ